MEFVCRAPTGRTLPTFCYQRCCQSASEGLRMSVCLPALINLNHHSRLLPSHLSVCVGPINCLHETICTRGNSWGLFFTNLSFYPEYFRQYFKFSIKKIMKNTHITWLLKAKILPMNWLLFQPEKCDLLLWLCQMKLGFWLKLTVLKKKTQAAQRCLSLSFAFMSKCEMFCLDALVRRNLALPAVLLRSDWNALKTGSLHLQLGQPFDGLERPQDSEDPQGLDCVNVLAFCPSVQTKTTVNPTNIVKKMIFSQSSHPSNTEAGGTLVDILVEMSDLPVSRGHACELIMLFYRSMQWQEDF